MELVISTYFFNLGITVQYFYTNGIIVTQFQLVSYPKQLVTMEYFSHCHLFFIQSASAVDQENTP
jgi:hypothetical protein